jgi:hypothetical protein
MRIENGLNSNVPSWSTHPGGFSVYIEWVNNGLGWGTIGADRYVINWREQFTNVTIVGGFTQMTNSSQEVIWLRGGGNYYFSADADVTPTIRTTTYESNGQTVAPRTSIFNNPREATNGRMAVGSLQTSETSLFRANLAFPDTVNTGITNAAGDAWVFVDDGFGNFFAKNASGGFYGDFTSYNFRSAASSEWAVMNASEFRHNSSLRAPIFYDSNDTGYYIDPNTSGTSIRVGGWAYFGLAIDGDGIVINHDQIWTPNGNFHIQYSSAGNLQLMHGGGSVKIGTFGTPSHKLHVQGVIFSENDVRAPIFYDSGDTGYYANLNGISQFSSIYANDWFRAQGVTGLWFQDYGRGLRSPDGEGNSYGNVATHGTGRNGWSGWGIGSRHVFMSTTGDNVGVHDNSRGWIWYWNGSFTSFDFGYTQFAGSARSPIFYDNNDTGYYADLNSTGDSIRAAGNIVAYFSDDKLKTKFGNIDNAVDKVCKLNGFYYEANETAQKLGYKPKREVGVSAQEVQEVLPEVVTGAPIGHGYLTVDYERIVPLLIEAIKELKAEIEMLKAR